MSRPSTQRPRHGRFARALDRFGRRRMRTGAAFATVAALALAPLVAVPGVASAVEGDVSGVVFDWGINNESNGGAYFGGCNFLSAGVAGDTGSARLWTEADGFYRSADGNTTIVKPSADGSSLVSPTWATKCQTPSGTSVNSNTNGSNTASYTQSRVQISEGSGSVDVDANTADISWDGSFTVAYYGGMTYWSASDPHLVVNADGTGTVTATLSGYGTDMDDMSIWQPIAGQTVTLANLTGVEVTDTGFEVTPDYLGVTIPEDINGRNPQDMSGSWAGAFPGDFLEFQQLTGQNSYWYSTAGTATSIQPRKATLPLTITYETDTDQTETPKPSPTPSATTTPTETPEPTETTTPKPTETATPKPTETAAPEPTSTATPKPTETPRTDDDDGDDEHQEGDLIVSDVVFDWGINDESNGGAYFGGCNFLSAGVAGDTGSARLWTEDDGFYASEDGNTTIVKPSADGDDLVQPTWSTKCQTPAGDSVNGNTNGADPDSMTQTRVQIAAGSGVIDPEADDASITWEGSFTVAYYGGMTYWSATDPVLEVRDGVGTITATLSGYGTDMDDLSIWQQIAGRDVVIAELTDVDVTDDGIVHIPDYLGVTIPDDISGRNPQNLSEDWSGAFPADFLEFQQLTGQNSYWYSTDGGETTIQPRKPTLAVTIAIGHSEAASTSPRIATQPRSQTVSEGETATFSVSATGSAPLTYTWQSSSDDGESWVDTPVTSTVTEEGASGPSLGVVATLGLDGSQYRVVVRNDVGETASEAATLSVTTVSGTDDDTTDDTTDDGTDGETDGDEPTTGDDTQQEPVQAEGALFDWGVNNESNGGSYFGGCNFLSAGVAGDAGSSRLWTEADGLYRTQDGNTTIVKPSADGASLVQPTWDTKCQTPSGSSVNAKTTNGSDTYTQTRVRISGGTGTLDPAANTADLQWTGSFTVVYYGGMTYWSVSDPHLVVNADGTGTVTATATGFGTDMDDASKWSSLGTQEVTLANLTGVVVTASGFQVTPDYLGVSVPDDIAGRNAQPERTDENNAWWGAFPADFLEFQVLTGQSSYWYTTSGGAGTIQPRKVTLPLTICATSDCTVPSQASTGGTSTSPNLQTTALQAPNALTPLTALTAPEAQTTAPEVEAASASAAGSVTVIQQQAAALAETGVGLPIIAAGLALIGALGLLLLTSVVGGTLFLTGTLSGGGPRRS